MKISIKIFLSLFFLLSVISQASADTLILKNGYQMEGIIKRETDEYVELEINTGTVKFYRGQIERVEHSSQEERKLMQESWEEERLKSEAQQKTRQQQRETGSKEIAVGRQGNHLFANVVLNGKVNAKLLIDTGSSFIVLSPAIARGLNISMDAEKPDLKLTLADGREVPGKMLKLDTISIGEARANDVQAAVIYQEAPFQGYDGLLGMSFLKLFKFEINLEKSSIILNKL